MHNVHLEVVKELAHKEFLIQELKEIYVDISDDLIRSYDVQGVEDVIEYINMKGELHKRSHKHLNKLLKVIRDLELRFAVSKAHFNIIQKQQNSTEYSSYAQEMSELGFIQDEYGINIRKKL